MSKRTRKRKAKRPRPLSVGRRRMFCPACNAPRLHDLATRVDDSGYFIRVWICSAKCCCLASPAGGFVCRMCGHPKFWSLSRGNIRNSRPDQVLRVQSCRECETDHLTSERILQVIEAGGAA